MSLDPVNFVETTSLDGFKCPSSEDPTPVPANWRLFSGSMQKRYRSPCTLTSPIYGSLSMQAVRRFLLLLAPGFRLKPLLFGSDCEDFVNVDSPEVNTHPGNGIKATTKFIESSTTKVKVTVHGVSAKARNVGADAIDIVAGPTLVKTPIPGPGLLALGELTFNAHLSDLIDWTYSATCDGLPFTYSGPQFVFVHTK
jgi:hypothetical protein